MDFYEFVDRCREDGLTSAEAEGEWDKACNERAEAFRESYYSDPMVNYGWYKQDMIDLRYRER